MGFCWNTVVTSTAKPVTSLGSLLRGKMTNNQKKSTTRTTNEITGFAGNYRDSPEFYSDRATLDSLSDDSQEDLTDALATAFINPEDFEREDQEDDEFVIVDSDPTADEWHVVEVWVKY